MIHFKPVQGVIAGFTVDGSIVIHLCKITYATKQAVGNAWCTTGAFGYFHGTIFGAVDLKERGRAVNDCGQFMGVVKLKPFYNSEAIPQWIGQKAGTCGCTNQCETGQLHFDGAGGRALSDHNIKLKILHGRIEDLLNLRT